MPQPRKQCLSCSYTLEGLSENRCPECGRPFDPTDSRTFKIERSSGRILWEMLLAPNRVQAALFLVLLVLIPIVALLISLLIPFLREQ